MNPVARLEDAEPRRPIRLSSLGISAAVVATVLLIVALVPPVRALENQAVDVYYVVGSYGKTNSSAASHYVQEILNLSREDPALYAFNRTVFSSRIRVPESTGPGELGPEISTNLWINRAGPGGPPGTNGTSSGPTSYVDLQRRMTITFEKLVEFIDRDGDAVPSSSDTVVSESPLLNATGSGPYIAGLTVSGVRVPLELSPLDASLSAGSVTPDSPIWTSLTAIESGFEVKTSVAALNITSFAFLRPVEFKNRSMDPSEIKIDIRLQRVSVAGTSLAVVTLVSSQDVGIIHDGGTDWGGMRATSDGISSFFTWESTALVDGTSKPVGVTAVQLQTTDQYSATIVFAYPPGSVVVHDPELGFDIAAPLAGAWSPPTPLLLFASAVVGIIVLAVWVLWTKSRRP